MVFERVLAASGAFSAASCAVAALVFGVVVDFTMHGCYLLPDFYF